MFFFVFLLALSLCCFFFDGEGARRLFRVPAVGSQSAVDPPSLLWLSLAEGSAADDGERLLAAN
jgi:hypothetical protein